MWLSAQPHCHKVFVAGNHDILLDEAFLEMGPHRRCGQKTREDLDWGSVVYLEDESVALDFSTEEVGSARRKRTLTVFGSPWTPIYGVSAFQYHPKNTSHWVDRLSSQAPDVLVTHGPPRLHLDRRGFHRAGCHLLAEEVSRIKPRLVVFGHIHAAHGREDVVLDGVQRAYEDVVNGVSGWEGVLWMAFLVLWERDLSVFRGFRVRREEATTFVNASSVGGDEPWNAPIVVELDPHESP